MTLLIKPLTVSYLGGGVICLAEYYEDAPKRTGTQNPGPIIPEHISNTYKASEKLNPLCKCQHISPPTHSPGMYKLKEMLRNSEPKLKTASIFSKKAMIQQRGSERSLLGTVARHTGFPISRSQPSWGRGRGRSALWGLQGP